MARISEIPKIEISFHPDEEERRDYLKNLFGDLNPRAIANYSIMHPEDSDLHEYITKFTSPEFNRELFKLIPYSREQ